ncbi:MAG: F0F1 ATP synthase subunit gamma [Endomicrobium sp.]|jgi:F-type H+-transporting ATPase subunit gamma|nr:F0F1 ATP synthase subunit gamma [Endomicrobium sp.]
MAQNLQQIKKKIQATKNIAKLSKIIELLATSRLHKSQHLLKTYTIYIAQFSNILIRLINNISFQEKHCNLANTNNGLFYIVFPAKGFCGDIGIKLIKKVNVYLSNHANYKYIVPIGGKYTNIILKGGKPVFQKFNIEQDQQKLVYQLLKIAKRLYKQKNITMISIAYTKFDSMLIQRAVVEDIISNNKYHKHDYDDFNYIFEQNVNDLYVDLLPYYIEIAIKHALINSHVSEQAARIMTMKNSRDNAYDVLFHLTNFYNKIRQEKINYDILDLINCTYSYNLTGI